MVSEKSSTPRLRTAACHSGLAWTASSQAMNSSCITSTCTPSTCSQATTRRSASETTPSNVARRARSLTTTDASRLPADRGARGGGNRTLARGPPRAVVEDDGRLARPARAGLYRRLGRLVQGDEDEARAAVELLLGLDDGRRRGHLLGGQRLERV